eukprot:NODE_1623_length_821_cov_20.290155_g1261_i0.p1 GENE.NODE_1623_length_821_cov_20.290155_g1261_i0~~NODE_1623_length_821_cov_20.290155_g1261_i0.p1  ORF type:complete len:189 (-),score=10.25 NODE_1623_length_821_cov_20.290155_g1261_i0:77-643(-)
MINEDDCSRLVGSVNMSLAQPPPPRQKLAKRVKGVVISVLVVALLVGLIVLLQRFGRFSESSPVPGSCPIGRNDHTHSLFMHVCDSETYRAESRWSDATQNLSWDLKEYHSPPSGTFHCACCGAPLWDSEMAYDSGTGWPAFDNVLPGAVNQSGKLTLCASCGLHLGEFFEPHHYCIDSVCMAFHPRP